MRMNLFPILLLSLQLCGGVPRDACAQEPATDAEATAVHDRLLADLGSKDFSVRSAASARLKELTASDILRLATRVKDQPNAEVVVRVQAEIDARYESEDPADVTVASKVLEAQAGDPRLMLADGARQSLRQHWRQRIELAIKALEEHGAIVRRGTFTKYDRFNPFPRSSEDTGAIRILLTETWTGGDAGVAIFQRLTALCGPVLGEAGIKLYLLQGNRLTEEQERQLVEVVGQNRVAKRSRVALGISPYGHTGPGVLIGQVTAGSSAADAGLKPGNLIVAILPKNSEPAAPANKEGELAPEIVPGTAVDKTLLRDFDDLVERLMEYREGDVMTVRVQTAGHVPGFDQLPGNDQLKEANLEEVKVTMKGWQDLIPE